MKNLRNDALNLLEAINEKKINKREAQQEYFDLIEETFEQLQEDYSIYEGGQLRTFIETIQEIRLFIT